MASPLKRTHKDYTIGIVCALPVEKAAVVMMLDEQHERLKPTEGDDNSYTLGRVGIHNVVVACLPAGMTGNNSAATVARDMKRTYPIKIGLLVGVGGGVWSSKTDIRLGDVIVSQPVGTHGGVVQWDFGKMEARGFRRTGSLNKPPRVLLNALSDIQVKHMTEGSKLAEYHSAMLTNKPLMAEKFGHQGREHDQLFQATYHHQSGETCDGCDRDKVVQERPARADLAPRIHYGNIASGNEVMKDGVVRDVIARKEDIICFEMEAAGLMDTFPCLVIRGICDYSDSHKNKRWQPYAAATAAAFSKELLEVIDKQEAEYREPSASKTHVYIPFDRNPNFVGRGSQLRKLQENLFVEGQTPKVAIVGLGGVGKTQIALELAYQTKEDYQDCSIFWVAATSNDRLRQAYRDIGHQLGIPEIDKTADLAGLFKIVQQSLSRQEMGRWLIIFDNADDIDMWIGNADGSPQSGHLIDNLPRSDHGSIVFTTRTRKNAVKLAKQNIVEVLEMEEDVASQMFATSLVNKSLLETQQDTSTLLRHLTFLPLAISQAAAYINENNIEVSEYLQLLEESEEGIVDLLSEDFEDDGRYRDIKNPVAATWLISFEFIRRHDALAADYLSFMACIDSRNIPESLLPPAPSRKKQMDAIGTLNAYSFITKRKQVQALDLHRLVHLATRNWLRIKDLLSEWAVKATTRIEELFPSLQEDNRSLWRTYLPHVSFLLSRTPLLGFANRYPVLLEKYGLCLSREWRFDEAEQALESVWEARKTAFGEDHPQTISCLSNLAQAYQDQGRSNMAETLGKEVMEMRKKVLGEDHPLTLFSINSLAVTYVAQGRLDEAKKLHVQIVDSTWTILESGKIIDYDALVGLHMSMVTAYLGERDFNMGGELQKSLVGILTKTLGEDHPSTLQSMDLLLMLMSRQGRFKEAEQAHLRQMEVVKRAYGEESPLVLSSLRSLEIIYWCQERFKEAEQVIHTGLDLCKRVLGEEHPDTIDAIVRLANVHLEQGQPKEAELEMKKVEKWRSVLGENHTINVTYQSIQEELDEMRLREDRG